MKFLTSTQTKRLKDLAAREEDLDEAELSELNFLRNLADEKKAEEPESDTSTEEEDSETEDSVDDEDEEEESTGEGEEDASAGQDKKKLSIFDRANAVLTSKTKLAKKAKGASAELDAANARIAELEAENEQLQKKADQGEALAKRVAELEHETTTVGKRAAAIAAGHHCEEDDLPPSAAEGGSLADLEDLRSQIREEKDLKKKAALVQKVKQLRSASLN
jgi:hypothetical protein